MANNRRYSREREYEVAYDITYLRGNPHRYGATVRVTRRVYRMVKAHNAKDAEMQVLDKFVTSPNCVRLNGTRDVTRGPHPVRGRTAPKAGLHPG